MNAVLLRKSFHGCFPAKHDLSDGYLESIVEKFDLSLHLSEQNLQKLLRNGISR